MKEKERYTYTGKEVGEIERKYETQLEEKEKEIEKLNNALILDYDTGEWRKICEMQEENKKLNQQLKSQPKKIVEKIKGQLLSICQIRQYHRSEEVIMSYQAFNNILNTILKEYGE